LTATAVYSRLTFRRVSRLSTVSPGSTSIGLPLTLIVTDTNGRSPRAGAAVIPSAAVFPSPALSGSGSRGPGPHPVLRNPPPTTDEVEYTPRRSHVASPIAFTASGFSSDDTSPAGLPR